MTIRTRTWACSLSSRPRSRALSCCSRDVDALPMRLLQARLGPDRRITPADVLEAFRIGQQGLHAAGDEGPAGWGARARQRLREAPGVLVRARREQRAGRV